MHRAPLSTVSTAALHLTRPMSSSDERPPRRPSHRRREITPDRLFQRRDWRDTIRHVSRQHPRPRATSLRIRALRREVLGTGEEHGENDGDDSGTGSDGDGGSPSDGGSEGVGEAPSPSMSSSSDSDDSEHEEERRAMRKLKFHPGVDDPEKFWQKLEFKVADSRAGYDNRSLLGKLIKCLRRHPVKAEPLLLWKERNQLPGGLPIRRGPGGGAPVLLATRLQLKAAFIAQFPQIGSREKSDALREQLTQTGYWEEYFKKQCEGLVKGGFMAANTLLLRTNYVDMREIKKIAAKAMETVSYKILDEFPLTAALRAGLMEKILDGQVNNLQELNTQGLTLEEKLQALAVHCGILDGTYWSKKPARKTRGTKAGKKKTNRKKKEQSSEEDDVALAAEDDSTLQALLALADKFEAYEKAITKSMLELETRVKEHAEGRLKEVKEEIEQDLFAPLKSRFDNFDSKLDKLIALGSNQAPAAKVALPFAPARPGNTGGQGWQGNRSGGKGGYNGTQGVKRELICYKCGKKGHPFRLCPELDVAACMECATAADQYEQGGTEVCSMEDLHDSFGEMAGDEPDVVCMLALQFARDKIARLHGAATAALAAGSDSMWRASQVQRRRHCKEQLQSVNTLTSTKTL